MGHYLGEIGETEEEATKRNRYGRLHEKLGHVSLSVFMASDLLLLAKFLGITKYGPSEDDIQRLELITSDFEST